MVEVHCEDQSACVQIGKDRWDVKAVLCLVASALLMSIVFFF